MAEFYDEVAKVLGATNLSPLRPGGQKRVFAAKRGHEDVELKAVEILPPRQAEVLERASREVALLNRRGTIADKGFHCCRLPLPWESC